MDLLRELDRITEPAPAASPVRMLSTEEIERLQASGEITPIEQIPARHWRYRVHFPNNWGRGTYGYGK